MLSSTVEAPNIQVDKVEISPKTEIKAEQKKKIGWFMKTVKAVWAAVKWVFKALVGIGLFITNPSFFAVGFIAGIILSDKVRLAVNKVKLVWEKQPWTVTIIFGLGAFLALPITMAASALLFGSNLGASLTEYAEEKDHKEKQGKGHEEVQKLFQDPDAVRV